MAVVFKVVVLALFLMVVAFTEVGVSAQTHHVVGGDSGWGPELDVGSWLSGRVFSVGDKIWFKHSGGEDSVVEVEGLEEFKSCNLTNPIRMYTDPLDHVLLEKEGVRYFTSANPESCKNGLKLPVPVQPAPEFDPPYPDPSAPFDPPYPHGTPPPYKPYPPVKPTPPYEPPVPVRPPPTPPSPSAAPTHLGVVSFMLSAGLLLCSFIGI